MSKYGFAPEDIWNFDETGFATGLCSTTEVVTNCDYYGRAKLLQPGNHEWVTANEVASAVGEFLPPYIILQAKGLQDAWFEDLPSSWRLDISDNSWTTDKIGIKWLQNHFIPETAPCQRGAYRLLFLDGHGSHLTPEFDQLCMENKIIPTCLPARSSHLLQPFNVSVFAPLKASLW